MGGVIVSSRVAREWFYAQKVARLGQKFGEGVMERDQKIGIFLFSQDLASHALQQADWAL